VTGRARLDDAALIERLADLGRDLAWPSTPDMAGRVTAAIEAGSVRRSAMPEAGSSILRRIRELVGIGGPGGRRALPRSLLLAVVALLVIVVVAAAIGLGVPGIRIDLRPLPTATPGATAGASTSPSGSGVDGSPAFGSPVPTGTPPGPEIGPSVSLDDARRTAGFGLLVPTAAGYATPDEVHLNGAPPFARVTFVYADGTTLTEFLGEVQPDAFQKMVGPGTSVEPVRVGGSSGYWITGAPHEVVIFYLDPDGQSRWQQVTVTGNVLIWQAGKVTLRLQTPLDRVAAIALAQSAR
jgi:hypothetical protein